MLEWLKSIDYGEKNKVEQVTIVAVMLIGFGGAYFFYNQVKNTLKSFWDNTEADMKAMVEDLHGVLDRCFLIERADIV